MPKWRIWSLVVAFIALPSVGCEARNDEQAESDGGESQLAGTVNEAPFATRGVLAHRPYESRPSIEIRLLSRSASCESFDEDYESREDEPIVILNLDWPKSEGDRVFFRAAETDERIQFCRGNARGRALCTPRGDQEGSVTVLEASPEGGVLSLDVTGRGGSLSGRLPFTLCSRSP